MSAEANGKSPYKAYLESIRSQLDAIEKQLQTGKVAEEVVVEAEKYLKQMDEDADDVLVMISES